MVSFTYDYTLALEIDTSQAHNLMGCKQTSSSIIIYLFLQSTNFQHQESEYS